MSHTDKNKTKLNKKCCFIYKRKSYLIWNTFYFRSEAYRIKCLSKFHKHESTVISPFTYSKAYTHSNLLSMSEIEICLLFSLSLSFPLILSFLRWLWLSRWIESKMKFKCFLFSIRSLTAADFSAEVDSWNERIYIQKKKHQTKQKFMAIWIFEQKMKSTHTLHRQVLSICGKETRKRNCCCANPTNRMIYPHKFQEKRISMKF